MRISLKREKDLDNTVRGISEMAATRFGVGCLWEAEYPRLFEGNGRNLGLEAEMSLAFF